MSEWRDFSKRVQRILRADARYHQDAYLFVMAALGRILKSLEVPRHVTGAELLTALQAECEEQFGPMGEAILNFWGVKNSLDFGRIVFNMVQEGILSKTEQDSIEDFNDALFFDGLFNQEAGYRLSPDEVRPVSVTPAKNGSS